MQRAAELIQDLERTDDVVESISGKYTLKSEEFGRLRPKRFLSDECIGAYFELLQHELASEVAYHFSATRFWFVEPMFLEKFKQRGYDYSKVARWYRRMTLTRPHLPSQIDQLDMAFFRFHSGSHFSLFVVNFKQRRIEHYDSLDGSHEGKAEMVCRWLQRYIADETSQDSNQTTFDFSGWCFYTPPTPQQAPSSMDCGVFVCQFSRLLAKTGSVFELEITMADTARKRQTMLAEIMARKLL